MIVYELLRQAAATADPHATLDRVVRTELSAGRTTADIYAEVLPLARALRSAPGLSAEGAGALTGMLDALTGDCDPEQVYQDPPSSRIPTVSRQPDDTGRDPRTGWPKPITEVIQTSGIASPDGGG
jgi:hypothetical protein